MDYSSHGQVRESRSGTFGSAKAPAVGHLKRTSKRTGWAGCLLLSGSLGCSSPSTTDPCPGEQPPAFSVTLRAKDGPLPRDTHIVMAYGGGSEEYQLGVGDGSPSVMFCRAAPSAEGTAGANAGGAAGASSDAGLVDKLVCELWIEGAATIWVKGGSYPELEVELRGEANECGPETVEEELILGEDGTDPSGP